MILEAERLYRFYHAGDDETLALRGVSLSVAAGELVAITGPSGSGKSTLLNCLAGLDEPDGGQVRIAGERYQQANLVGHLSVAGNVALAQHLNGEADAERRDRVLERCAIAARSHARPAQLSGGELARAGLAVALANDPPLVLADEPTGELDQATAARILALLREQADAGVAVVVITHSPAVAALADRELQLHDGVIA
jgi:putative ABC transport system ATP-binding protein